MKELEGEVAGLKEELRVVRERGVGLEGELEGERELAGIYQRWSEEVETLLAGVKFVGEE